MPSPFPPIEDYAFLSDCHTGALVAPDGAVAWLCVPRFDSPSVFGTILDREAGYFRLGPFGINVPTAREYEPGTNILATTWRRRGRLGGRPGRPHHRPSPGRGQVTPHTRPPADNDADHMLVRTVECIDGQVEIELVCEPVFDYGRTAATWTAGRRRPARRRRHRRRADDPAADRHGARHRGRPGPGPPRPPRGERAYCAPLLGRGPRRPERRRRGRRRDGRHHRRLADMAREDAEVGPPLRGRTWSARPSRSRASPTCRPEPRSRPSRPRCPRPRAASATGTTATRGCATRPSRSRHSTGSTSTGRPTSSCSSSPTSNPSRTAGSRSCTASTAGGTSPRRPATTCPATPAPARSASATAPSTSARTTCTARCSTRSCSTPAQPAPARRLWPMVESQADVRHRRSGASPTRASGRPAASRSTTCPRSSCAGWPSTGRASWPPIRGDTETEARWRATAEEIRADILEHGVERARACSASTTTPTRSTPPTCWRRSSGSSPATTSGCGPASLAIAEELTENGFVLRYRTDETDDGLSGKEGTFLICSFWLVSALAIIGEEQRARDLMDRLLRVASPLGLYAEEFDTDTSHHLGNFPQAFSHLALIEAAARIILLERVRERTTAHDEGDRDLRRHHHRHRRRRRHPGPPPRTVGRTHPRCSSGATGCPREPSNWSTADVFVDGRYISADTWYDPKGKAFQPQIHYFVGGATKLYGAALYRLRAEDFGELRHHDGLSPAGRSRTTDMEPYYTQAEQLYEVHGARGEDPTERPASAPYPFPAVSTTSPDPAARRRPRRRRLPPVPRTVRRPARRGEHAVQHLRAVPDSATASRARCTPSRTPRCWACARRSSTPNVTLLTGAKARRAGDEQAGTRSPRWWWSATAATERYRRASSSWPAARRTRPSCCSPRRTTGTRRDSPTAPTRSGATTCSTTARRSLALSREKNPTVFQKTLGPQRLLLRQRRVRLPDGQHPDGRQVAGADVPGRRSRSRRGWRPGGRSSGSQRHAVDFWLSTEDLPTARTTGSPSTGRRHHAGLHGDRTRSRRRGCTRS